MEYEIDSWLASLPTHEGYASISEPRRFQHDEEDYDGQYENDEGDLSCGLGTVNFIREAGLDTKGPALEIGCGTGLMSLGIAAAKAFPLLLLTDPSPVFLNITKAKLERNGLSEHDIRLALLLGEDLDRLPEGMFSLIALRSALHHVLDVERFIGQAARALRHGGGLVFQEPCREGYVMMGVMAQFLPALCEHHDPPLTEGQLQSISLFVRTMQFYARRDMNKEKAEDKHVFRVDELMAWSREAGLDLQFWPNAVFEHFADDKRRAPDRFRRFFLDYLRLCMGFDEDLMAIIDHRLSPHCEWLEELADAGSPTYMHGIFVARKP